MNEFVVKGMCSLCANKGIIDSRGIRTPAGFECGGLHYCICPNGRALKKCNADKQGWLSNQMYPRTEPPQWGLATVCRNEDTGKLFWKCEVDAEDGETELPVIELAANTFKEGTIVRVYEPIEHEIRQLFGKRLAIPVGHVGGQGGKCWCGQLHADHDA